ncbi:uncharacterized protein NKAPD1 isoform X3 [Micropterus salmoides]|uniref:uncharacterized protein NKAPD1 isoform X3 n=1 Tax=Micropterus salmoides TaxID=27706 RepID=UPI0018EB1382|nr:uncharacterized protein NKAPD1 isoform X3 [Micropterus salmoides]
MSKQPLGKTLLRNVIRHTDAHNKIQEEMEMWKMRDWETATSHHKHLSDTECVRGRVNRVPDQPRDLSRSRERISEHDDREARYWSRKLYEFKASDPDRWGHSGFKELYPEEFESDRHQQTCALGPLCGRSVKQFHIHLCSGLKHTDRQYRQQAAWRGMVRYLPHASWRILSAAGSLIDHLVSPHSVCLTRRPFVSQVSSPIIIGCALYFIHFVFNLYYICMQHSNFHTGLYYSESYICCQIN